MSFVHGPKRHLFIAPISRLFLSAFPSLFIVSPDEKIDIFFHVFVRAARRLSIVAAVPRWADLGGIGVRVCFGDGFVTENVDHHLH